MKLSIATFAAATIFSLAEGKLQATKEENMVLADTQRRNLDGCPFWAWWCNDSDSSDSYDEEFVGNCKHLDGFEGVVHTGYDLTDEIVFTYPCSGGYMANFAANYNLLHDLREEIGDCANLCNIDNGYYELTEWDNDATSGSIADLPNGDVWCGAGDTPGTLEDTSISVGFDAADPCRCDPDNEYYAGCKHCYGTVRYRLVQCGDSSAFD